MNTFHVPILYFCLQILVKANTFFDNFYFKWSLLYEEHKIDMLFTSSMLNDTKVTQLTQFKGNSFTFR